MKFKYHWNCKKCGDAKAKWNGKMITATCESSVQMGERTTPCPCGNTRTLIENIVKS